MREIVALHKALHQRALQFHIAHIDSTRRHCTVPLQEMMRRSRLCKFRFDAGIGSDFSNGEKSRGDRSEFRLLCSRVDSCTPVLLYSCTPVLLENVSG